MARMHGLSWLRSASLVSAFFVVLSTQCRSAGAAEPQVTKVADGIYVIQHSNEPVVTSNSTVIIGDREVFVVDSEFWPSMAREDIAQIRQWTSKPVGYLLNTHFHNDHNNGNRAYIDAFPALAIIAHVETKKDMDLIQPGNIAREPLQWAKIISNFKQGKGPQGQPLTPELKTEIEPLLPKLEQVVADFEAMVYQPPTLTFTDELDIDLGNRPVQVRHLGKGNTPGDTIVYLPKEKIMIAGDLLVHPIPYTFDGYPAEWVGTLRRMAQFDAQAIIPGHGPVLHDKNYLYLVTDLMSSAVEQVRAAIGKTGHPGFYPLEKIKGEINLTQFRRRFVGDDKDLGAQFDTMVDHLVKLVFSEAAIR